MGHSRETGYAVMVIGLHGTYNFTQQLLNEVSEAMGNKDKYIIDLDKKNRIVVILTINKNDVNDYYQIVKNKAVKLLNAINNISSIKDKWKIGISRLIVDISYISSACREATVALEFLLEIKEKRSIQFYSELDIYHLFSHPMLKNEVKNFVYNTLNPLLYNEKNYSYSLIETFSTFLNCRCNYRATGEYLHIHHNTVRYRISIINQILNDDISKSINQLKYKIALLLFPMVKERNIINQVQNNV